MSAPIVQPGDCIHLAIPDGPNFQDLMANTVRAYERLGVRVFMIDCMPSLAAATVVGVVRGVPDGVVFSSNPQGS